MKVECFQIVLQWFPIPFQCQISFRVDGSCPKEKLKLSEINLTVWCHFAREMARLRGSICKHAHFRQEASNRLKPGRFWHQAGVRGLLAVTTQMTAKLNQLPLNT